MGVDPFHPPRIGHKPIADLEDVVPCAVLQRPPGRPPVVADVAAEMGPS